jgi:hypothetical protein
MPLIMGRIYDVVIHVDNLDDAGVSIVLCK